MQGRHREKVITTDSRPGGAAASDQSGYEQEFRRHLSNLDEASMRSLCCGPMFTTKPSSTEPFWDGEQCQKAFNWLVEWELPNTAIFDVISALSAIKSAAKVPGFDYRKFARKYRKAQDLSPAERMKTEVRLVRDAMNQDGKSLRKIAPGWYRPVRGRGNSCKPVIHMQIAGIMRIMEMHQLIQRPSGEEMPIYMRRTRDLLECIGEDRSVRQLFEIKKSPDAIFVKPADPSVAIAPARQHR